MCVVGVVLWFVALLRVASDCSSAPQSRQQFHLCALPSRASLSVVCVDDLCWVEHTNPFGTRSASSNSGQTGSAAVVDIWDAEYTDITFKYKDNISQLLFPSETGPFIDGLYHYHHDRDSSMALIAPLNVPWHPTKTGDCFISIFVFIGFLWDLIHKRVSLPEPKCQKFLDRVFVLIMKAENHQKVSLLDVQKIHGSLIHLLRRKLMITMPI